MTTAPNTSMLPVPRLDGSANPQQVIDALDLAGCAVVESLVDAETVDVARKPSATGAMAKIR